LAPLLSQANCTEHFNQKKKKKKKKKKKRKKKKEKKKKETNAYRKEARLQRALPAFSRAIRSGHSIPVNEVVFVHVLQPF
jgi:hypothetical protein